jgi:hypothetical protein
MILGLTHHFGGIVQYADPVCISGQIADDIARIPIHVDDHPSGKITGVGPELCQAPAAR